MGLPKHKENRKNKYKKYESEMHLAKNRQKKQEKLAAGKKIKSRKTPKTILMRLQNLVKNQRQTKPYVDVKSGLVLWGRDVKDYKDGKPPVKPQNQEQKPQTKPQAKSNGKRQAKKSA